MDAPRGPRAIAFELNERDIPIQQHPTIRILYEMDYRSFSLPKRLLTMRAERWDAASGVEPQTHDFVASPAGAVYEEVAKRLNAS